MPAESTPSIQDTVYTTLKDGILSLKLMPGTSISTQEMATRLNVSRTPVREAFIRLQKEGLVEMLPQRETLIAKIDLKRVREEFFIRKTLELGIVRDLVSSCTEADFTLLEQNIEQQRICIQQQAYADFVRLDNEFHRILFHAAGHDIAWETIMSVMGHYTRLRVYTMHEEGHMPDVARMHSEILSAICQRDPELVRSMLIVHYRVPSIMANTDGETDNRLAIENPAVFCYGKENNGGVKIGVL